MTANSPPRWVAELVARVCEDEGAAQPRVEWLAGAATPESLRSKRTRTRIAGMSLNPNRDLSAGSEIDGVITVYRGQLRFVQRLVVLHELAHWLTGEWHTQRFWDKVWALYPRYAPKSVPFALEWESRYKAGAIRAAVRAGLLTPAGDAAMRALRASAQLTAPP